MTGRGAVLAACAALCAACAGPAERAERAVVSIPPMAGPDAARAAAIADDLVRTGYRLNTTVRDALRPDLRAKVRVYSWSGPGTKPYAMRHVWVFPPELMPEQNLPVPMPMEYGEPVGWDDGTVKPEEVRGLAHYIASSGPHTTLYFDLDRPLKVSRSEYGQPLNHPYEMAGWASPKGFSLPDARFLPDAMRKAGYPADETAAAGKNLSVLLLAWASDTGYALKSEGDPPHRRIRVDFSDKGSFYFWPSVERAGF